MMCKAAKAAAKVPNFRSISLTVSASCKIKRCLSWKSSQKGWSKMSFMNANCFASESPNTIAARRMCCSRFIEFLRLSYYLFVAILIFSFEFSFLFDARVLRFFERGVLTVVPKVF